MNELTTICRGARIFMCPLLLMVGIGKWDSQSIGRVKNVDTLNYWHLALLNLTTKSRPTKTF